MKNKKQFDPTFLLGLAIAMACIIGGLVLEKGQVKDVAQVTSALIVFGGTIGAVVVSTPMRLLRNAVKRAPSVFWSNLPEPRLLIDEIVRLSHEARKDGLKGLDNAVTKMPNSLLKKAMMLVVDDYDASAIRTILDKEMELAEQQSDEDARVYDAAGGYAPTIGIIGAVLGLMQVMKHLDNVQDVGRGIAIAFVATVYGVGIANLLFLPLASKIRAQSRQDSKIRQMIIEGALIVQEGKNPRLIRQLLEPYISGNGNDGHAAQQDNRTIEFNEGRKAAGY